MTPPWLAAESIVHAQIIVAAHHRHTRRHLIPATADPVADATALYDARVVVLAHDGGEDPRFVYANRTAQTLWGYTWAEFIGMPSRLSAPPDQRAVREGLLLAGRADGVVIARDLVRVTRTGRRFIIDEIVLWNLDQDGMRGQAATYGRWRFVDGDGAA